LVTNHFPTWNDALSEMIQKLLECFGFAPGEPAAYAFCREFSRTRVLSFAFITS